MLNFSVYKNKRIKCAGLGEVLFDVYPTGPKIGGATANFAFHCRQNGIEAAVISSVGKDALGFLSRDLLAKKFLPALLSVSDRSTGTVNVTLSDKGIPNYTFASDTAYDNINVNDEMCAMVSTLDMICFGTLAQRNQKSHKAIMRLLDMTKKDCLRVFDVNLRGDFYTKEIIEGSLQRSEIVKCNDDELPYLCSIAGIKEVNPDNYFEYLKSMDIFCFIYTEGAKQSSVYLNDQKSVQNTLKVEAVDTVGAGDSFTATLVSQLMKGTDLKTAHVLAVKVAAFVCTKKGAMPEIPYSMFD